MNFGFSLISDLLTVREKLSVDRSLTLTTVGGRSELFVEKTKVHAGRPRSFAINE